MHIDNDSSAGCETGTPGWRFAVVAGILGWILDAFDFFVVVFLINELMRKFHVGKGAIIWTMTLTLAMRPLGALLFGSLTDKFGRKRPLIVCVVYFSATTVLSGIAPTYWLFLATRLPYGVGMGGYWGIGASYAMESAPRCKRGLLSGVMQAGYPCGYLLAALGMQTVTPALGWNSMFFIGAPVTLMIVGLTILAPESAVWKTHSLPTLKGIFSTTIDHRGMFAYLLILMTVITCLSHGTQDLYPDFLETLPWVSGATILGMKADLGSPVVYNVAAIFGALIIGSLSERIGRRYAVIVGLLFCLISLPWWAFGATLFAVVIGSAVMQAGVQGAFGVIPAHINELAPDAIRGLFLGFVYQLGVLLASPVLPVQNILREHLGYPWALCSFELCVILSLFVIFAVGPEKHGRSFLSEPVA